MSKEVEGKLISDLLTSNNDEKIEELLREMENIGSNSFVFPIYELYKKSTTKHMSHYFLASLNQFDSNEVIKMAMEVGKNPDTSLTDKSYVIEIFLKRKFYENEAIIIGTKFLSSLAENKKCDIYDLNPVCTYLIEAGKSDIVDTKILSFFTNKVNKMDVRTFSLNLYIKFDPNNRVQELIDKYDDLKKDEDTDITIAKVLTWWKGPTVDKLRNLIKNSGNIRAKHVIETYERKKEKEKKEAEIKNEENIQKTYSNSEIIANIIQARENLNAASKRNLVIGFGLLNQNESIFKQFIAANDEATFNKACADLRSFITDINPELKRANIGYNIDEIKDLLPDVQESDYNKSINKLFLFIKSKKLEIDFGVLGLRELNRLLNLSLHPEAKDDYLELLKNLNLIDHYNHQEFAQLHKIILEKYLIFLKDITVLIESDIT